MLDDDDDVDDVDVDIEEIRYDEDDEDREADDDVREVEDDVDVRKCTQCSRVRYIYIYKLKFRLVYTDFGLF